MNLEARLQEPFNRFTDTLAADEVELNFTYVIQASLHQRLAHKGRVQVNGAWNQRLCRNQTWRHWIV